VYIITPEQSADKNMALCLWCKPMTACLTLQPTAIMCRIGQRVTMIDSWEVRQVWLMSHLSTLHL